MDLVDALAGLSIRINLILQIADPQGYEQHVQLLDALKQKAYMRALTAIDKLLWVGRSLIFNRETPGHYDGRDMPQAWTPLVTLGNTTGGDLRLYDLQTDLFYEPGTIVFVRGGALKHGVQPFQGTQRIAIAHFIHWYTWEENGFSGDDLLHKLVFASDSMSDN